LPFFFPLHTVMASVVFWYQVLAFLSSTQGHRWLCAGMAQHAQILFVA